MKRNLLPIILRPLSIASTAALVLTLLSTAEAQYSAGATIAASPKVRQILNERTATSTPAVAAVPAMSCPKCAEIRREEAGNTIKGAQILAGVKQVTYTHACAGCVTKMAVVGEGKAKHTVVAHKCTADVPKASMCCASN